MLSAGETAPSFTLDDAGSGVPVADPWSGGPVVLAFFKVSCPVCMTVAPMLTKLTEAGARVVAIGEDGPDAIARYNDDYGQRVTTTLTEPAPYRVSEAYGLEAVPTVFLVGPDGVITHAIAGWGRDTWNGLAASLGIEPLSSPDDGLRPYRPG